MKLILVGKMAGLPDLGASFFDEMKSRLISMGHDVVSPVDKAREMNWEAMERNVVVETFLDHSKTADGIVLLENWQDSEGALMEVVLATYLGKRIFIYHSGALLRLNIGIKDLVGYEPNELSALFIRRPSRLAGRNVEKRE